MSDTTDTPITDKHLGMIYRDGSPLIETSRDLERQLGEAREEIWSLTDERDGAKALGERLKSQLTEANRRRESWKEIASNAQTTLNDTLKQRDRLAEALREIKRFAFTRASHSWLERIAIEALATPESSKPCSVANVSL